MRFETPILTRDRTWYYDGEAQWLCVDTLDEFYYGEPAEVCVVIDTSPSKCAYRIRLHKGESGHESNYLLWQYRREPLQALCSPAEECLLRFSIAGYRFVYVTLYIYE